MNAQHETLAQGRWQTMSLAEQLGNIGSEVHRASADNADRALRARDRALELFDLTLADPRWRGRLREIARSREIFCDAALGGHEYGSALSDLEKYFDQFALVARKHA